MTSNGKNRYQFDLITHEEVNLTYFSLGLYKILPPDVCIGFQCNIKVYQILIENESVGRNREPCLKANGAMAAQYEST